MKCSVCSSEIKEKYCPKCGQYHKNKRISIKTIFGDLFGNLFSLEKSILKNIKIGLVQPKMLITNYWNGYRGYYYSPSKFLAIASLFFLLQISLKKKFLGIYFSIKNAEQFSILFFLIFLYSIITYIVYYKFKKNYYEHLILNIYNISLWSIIFVPISILISISGLEIISIKIFLIYLTLIIVWNSKVFELSNKKRFIYITIHIILLMITFFTIYKFYGD